MPTISDLQKEIAEEEQHLEFLKKKEEIHEYKKGLEVRLRGLKFQRRYGKQIATMKPIVAGVKSAFKTVINKAQTLSAEQNRRERQEKAIKKRGFQDRPRTLFDR